MNYYKNIKFGQLKEFNFISRGGFNKAGGPMGNNNNNRAGPPRQGNNQQQNQFSRRNDNRYNDYNERNRGAGAGPNRFSNGKSIYFVNLRFKYFLTNCRVVDKTNFNVDSF